MGGKTDPAVERLRSCPLFAGFGDAELAVIVQMTDEIAVDEGRVLTRQGEPAREAFVILEGTCRVCIDDVEIAEVGPGDVVGEMGLLEGGCRSATVVAATPVVLLAMDPRRFGTLVERQPVGRSILRQLAARLREADGRLTASG